MRASRTPAFRFAVLLLLPLLMASAGASARGVPIELARWNDPATEPSIEALRAASDERFEILPAGSSLLENARGHERWYRVRVTAPWNAADPPVLALYVPYGNRVTVHVPPDYAADERALRDLDLDQRHSRHALVFDLPATLGPDTPVYVRMKVGRRLSPQVAIEDAGAFARADIAYQRNITAILTAIAVTWLVVGAFGWVLREREFLLLFAAIGFQLLYLMMLTGEAYALPALAWLSGLGVVAIWISRALATAFLLLFTVHFLDLVRFAPRMRTALQACAAAFGVVVVLAPFPAMQQSGLPLFGGYLLILSSFLAMVAALLAWRRGSRAARFYLVAWLPAVALDVLRELQLLNLAPLLPAQEYALPLAGAFVAVMFAIGVADRMLAVRHERDEARLAAERDPLLRVLNRHAIALRLRAACDNAWASERPLSILFIDLDRFKSINDTYGHAVGDACLKAVVDRIGRELRQGDSLGRYGGEEFLVVLPGASAADAVAIADRVRADVDSGCRNVAGRSVNLTVSIGVAGFRGGAQTPDQLVAEADQAMYLAKRRGRNLVVVPDADPATAA
ncbi:MAG TPA: diguanylate cyclase [Pseudomonadota bacterium]|nr:diguanylate cyclase [Pseudomonadota bacterium]